MTSRGRNYQNNEWDSTRDDFNSSLYDNQYQSDDIGIRYQKRLTSHRNELALDLGGDGSFKYNRLMRQGVANLPETFACPELPARAGLFNYPINSRYSVSDVNRLL